MQIDKIIAKSANFIFEISSTISIRSINLNIPLESIIFYIVLFNALFLLYLTDIDKFGVFFNNITYQVILL